MPPYLFQRHRNKKISIGLNSGDSNIIEEGDMSDFIKSEKEGADICENCEASSYCSQLKLALAILGESLTESPSTAISQRYHDILRLLTEAGWNYPRSSRYCQMASQSDLARSLTDELIQLAKKKHRVLTPFSKKMERHPMSSRVPRPAMDVSLYEEETSCE